MNIICCYCNEECFPKIVNAGIGSYEYWGAKGYDYIPEVVSSCCKEVCMNEDGEYITVNDAERYIESEIDYYVD